MGLRSVALALVSALLIAGCSGGPRSSTETSTPSDPAAEPTAPEPFVSAETGGMYMTVLDEEQLPVAGAGVLLVKDQDRAGQTTTAADGSFSFGSLAPGMYAVHVGKLNYESLAFDVDVAAGEVVRRFVELVRVPEPADLLTTEIFPGKTTCTVSIYHPSGKLSPNCNMVDFPGDTWVVTYELRPGFHELLFETDWDPTYSYGDQLFQHVIPNPPGSGPEIIHQGQGPPPLATYLPHQRWVEWDEVNDANITGQGGSVLIATLAATNIVNQPGVLGVGMVIDQGFTVYTTIAYNRTVPAGYTALPDE